MRRKSTMFDSCWGLAIVAMAPLVIGTDMLRVPAAHAAYSGDSGGGWENPCDEDPQSDECGYFQDWLVGQHQLWLLAFGEVYDHEKSTMTLEPASSDEWDPWDVTVWLDAGLDYEDPDLDEQDVLDQIVTEGSIEFAYLAEIAWDAERHRVGTDVIDVGVLVTMTAGTITGPTGLEIPVVGNKMRIDVSNTLGNEQHTTYQYGVIESTATLQDAVNTAALLAKAALDTDSEQEGADSGPGRIPPGGNTPQPQPPPGVHPCCMSNEPEAAVCCECITDNPPDAAILLQCNYTLASDLQACRYTAGLAAGAIATGACVAICIASGVSPVCLACIGVGLIVIDKALNWCMRSKLDKYRACLASAYSEAVNCLAENDCDCEAF